MSEFSQIELLQKCKPKIATLGALANAKNWTNEVIDCANLINEIDQCITEFEKSLPPPPEVIENDSRNHETGCPCDACKDFPLEN